MEKEVSFALQTGLRFRSLRTFAVNESTSDFSKKHEVGKQRVFVPLTVQHMLLGTGVFLVLENIKSGDIFQRQHFGSINSYTLKTNKHSQSPSVSLYASR